MKKTAIVLLIAFGCIAISKAGNPDYNVANIPEELTKNANKVIREDFASYEYIGNSFRKHVKLAYTVFKSAANGRRHQLGYEKGIKIKSIKGTYYDATGKKIRTVEKDEILDRAAYDGISFVLDGRVKQIEANYGVLPYTFELEYVVEEDAFSGFESWYFQRYDEGVEHSEIQIITHAPYLPIFRNHNCNIEPVIAKEGDSKLIYRWEMKHLKPIEREAMMPDADEILPWIEMKSNQWEYDKHEFDMTNWETFGKGMYLLNAGRDNLSPTFAAEVKKMTENAQTNFEKIDILYRYMQKNMRYVSIQLGIGGFQTFEATFVEQKKYGDCKALVNFMKAMLKVIDIKAYTCAVSAGDDDFNDPDPNFCINQFNHVILHIPSENMWLECTSTDNPTGYLGAFTAGRNVMMFTEEGGKLLRTPTLKREDNKQASYTTLKVAADGSANFKSATILRGGLQDNMRMYITNMSKTDLQKKYQENMHLPAGSVHLFETEIDAKEPLTHINYGINMPRYANVSGTRLFVPFNLHNPFEVEMPLIEKRKYPVEQTTEFIETDTIELHIPTEYQVETLPVKEQVLENTYGKYTINATISESKILIIRNLEIKSVLLPAEEYSKLRDFYKKIQTIDASKIVLKKRT